MYIVILKVELKCSLKKNLKIPWWLNSKDSACSAGARGDAGLIPGLGRSPGEGNGNPLQCFCLGNPMDRGAWQAAVHRVWKESDMTEQLSRHALVFHFFK